MANQTPLRITIVGAGPAGLYTAILARRHLGNARVEVIEQNARGATFGFGVVFSDKALDFLSADDPQTVALLDPWMERWDNMTLNHPDGRVTLDGIGFSAIGRLQLLKLLEERAIELGVQISYDQIIDDVAGLDADVVVGADGLNSVVRRANEAAFAPAIDHFTNHFAWFGSEAVFDTLTQSFIDSAHGPLNAHHYRYAADRSTFIVECAPQTWAAHGFDRMGEADSAALCASLFEDVLGGARLITNKSAWRVFPRLWCSKWVAGNHVILGDAAHSSHFSIGPVAGQLIGEGDRLPVTAHQCAARRAIIGLGQLSVYLGGKHDASCHHENKSVFLPGGAFFADRSPPPDINSISY